MNNFYLAAKDIALLYRYRWQVELFFKWIKQHSESSSFGERATMLCAFRFTLPSSHTVLSESIEHDLKLGRPIMQVMRILGSFLLTKDDITELFISPYEEEKFDDKQLDFESDFY